MSEKNSIIAQNKTVNGLFCSLMYVINLKFSSAANLKKQF